MVKTVGIMLIIISCASMGFGLSGQMKKRIKELQELKKITTMLGGEIRYGFATIEEAFCSVAERISSPFAELFLAVAEKLAKRNGESFSVIWEEQVRIYLRGICLTQKDIEEFVDFGKNLGYLDLEMQQKNVEFYQERLQDTLKGLSAELDKKTKLYNSLGILGGIMLAIVIF